MDKETFIRRVTAESDPNFTETPRAQVDPADKIEVQQGRNEENTQPNEPSTEKGAK